MPIANVAWSFRDKMSFKIYYDHDPVFSSADGLPEDAPIDGVQVIMDYQATGGRIIHQGMDYYWWLGETWASGMMRDLELYLRTRPEKPIILFGRWMNTSGYRKIVEQAMADKDCGCDD